MADRERQPQSTPQVNVVALRGWPRGVNISAHPSLVEPDELVLASNVVLGSRGEIRQRPGMTPYPFFDIANEMTRVVPWMASDLMVVEGAMTQHVAQRAFFVSKAATEVWLLTLAAGSVFIEYEVDNGISRLFGPYDMVNMNNTAYLSSVFSAYEVKTTDGGSPERPDITELSEWNLISDTTTNYPYTSIVIQAYERLFAVQQEDMPYRLFFSEPLAPKTWKATNFIDINPDDGQGITALAYFADQLIIFKENSIWGISGKDFSSLDNLELYQIDNTRGISTSTNTYLQDLGIALMFVDTNQGVFAFDGSVLRNVGEPVWDSLKESITAVGAWNYDGKYCVAGETPGGSSGADHTYVYDIRRDAWTVWDRAWRDVALSLPCLPFTDSPALVGVGGAVIVAQQFDGIMEITEDALTDDGANIIAIVATGWISPSGGIARHRIRQAIIDTTTSDIDITVEAFADFDTVTPEATANLALASGEEGGNHWRSHAFNGFRWRSLQLVITATTTSVAVEPFQLGGITMLLSTLQQVRGDNVVAP